MAINPTERELRRIWGKDYDRQMDAAVDAYDALSPETQQRIDRGGPADLKALAAMQSEAYRNPKHPDHAAASKEVSETFGSLYGNAPPEVF